MKRFRPYLATLICAAAAFCAFSMRAVFAYYGVMFLQGSARTTPMVFELTPGGVLMGVIPFTGFLAGSGLSLLLGIGFCAFAVVPPESEAPRSATPSCESVS